MSRRTYLLDNGNRLAGERLGTLGELFDGSTFRHCEAVGIAAGWSCWEVGAGSTSVVRWLAERVGPGGRVLATDIDLTWTDDDLDHQVEVRLHDIIADPPPAELFDLVHARLLLMHLPERDRALQVMADAVRPGGWLILEDTDHDLQPRASPLSETPSAQRADRIRRGFAHLLAERGAELAMGRQLPSLLRAAGLVDVGADAYWPVALPAGRRLEVSTVTMLRDELLRVTDVSEEDVDEHLDLVRSGGLDVATSIIVSAWGRRPDGRSDGLQGEPT